MARQEIILGTPPLGLGGDPPRAASMKINAMTLELYQGLATTAAPLPITKGGTGGKTAAEARANLGAVGVGDYGPGATTIAASITDANSHSVSGWFNTPSQWVGALIAGVSGSNQGYLQHQGSPLNTYALQIWHPLAGGILKPVWRRKVAGVWEGWASFAGEGGANANGEYVKYADGTMICTYKAMASTDIALTSVSGGFYYRATAVTFPSAFISPPAVTNCTASTGLLTIPLYAAATTNNGCQLFQASASSQAAVGHLISYMAMGRWKA